MGEDGRGSDQEGLCCKELGHNAVNYDGVPENLKERDRCERNCVSGRGMRIDCRVGQTGCEKNKCAASAIIPVGYKDGGRRRENGGLGVVCSRLFM